MKRLLILAIACAALLSADWQPGLTARPWYIKGQAIPTSLTNIKTLSSTSGGTAQMPATDLRVCALTVSVAPGSAAINITIQDLQGTPWTLMNAVPITPTSTTGVTWNVISNGGASAPGALVSGCVNFVGGMSIQASATGAMIYVSGI